MHETPVYGLLLAGGRSRRMGRDKALLERDGRSQLEHAHALLERHVQRVFVSTRPDQADEPERSRFEQIVDRHDDLGPLAGILAAMDAYPDVDWLVLACDLPNVGDDTISHLLANLSVKHPFTAYVSSHDGLPEPLCAIWRSGSDRLIGRLLDDGIRCPRKILIRSDTHLVAQEDPRWLDNVNTPDDLPGSALEAGA
jgi:molybdopterin-guanine dinucleotide biosynthesis protein A